MGIRASLSPEQKHRLVDAIRRFPACRTLVVGDLMLDVFIWGEVRRISPEAPVPVVEVREETQLLGGAANVVHNVAALGGKATVSGIIGNDSGGRELIRLLRRASVASDGIVVEAERPTTKKTRIIAQNQQVVRFDHERCGPVQSESLDQILSYIEGNLPRIDAIIVSDYAKGVVSSDLMDNLRSLNTAAQVPVIVDPKVCHTDIYREVTMITPNHHEASRMSGIEIRDDETLLSAGKTLLQRLNCSTVLITRGREGMNLFDQNGQMTMIPTVARRVYDVTGAGDTVIAALTLGIVAGLSLADAALLANIAAGIVVGEVGTAVVSAERLLADIENGF